MIWYPDQTARGIRNKMKKKKTAYELSRRFFAATTMKHLINSLSVSVISGKEVKKPETVMRRNYFSLPYFKSF